MTAVLSTATELAFPTFLVHGLFPLLSNWGLALRNAVAILWFGPLSGEQSATAFLARLIVEGMLLLQL